MNQYLGRDEYDDDDFAEGFAIYDTWTQTQADSWDDLSAWQDTYDEVASGAMYDKQAQEDAAAQELAERMADESAWQEWLDTLRDDMS